MFVSAQEVFSNVKSMLSSYDAAGQINDSDLFRWTRDVMSRLGTSAKKEKSIVIDIERHQADLPEDFYLANGVYLCHVECEGGGTFRAQYGPQHTYTLQDWYRSTCYDKCDVCYDNNEYYLTRTLTRDIHVKPCKLTKRIPLQIDKSITKQKCNTGCINLSTECGYKFSIENNKIYTNFEIGNINLEYYALPVDEEGYPEIIDEPIIEQAVEDYLIYKSFQKIFYNGEADVQSRMQYAQAQYNTAIATVMHFIKLPSFASMIEHSKKRKNYLNIFNIPSQSDKVNTDAGISKYAQGAKPGC